VDDGRPEHPPGVAAPSEGGGSACLWRQPAGLGRHTAAENRQYSLAGLCSAMLPRLFTEMEI
jgi:hypothetical protein